MKKTRWYWITHSQLSQSECRVQHQSPYKLFYFNSFKCFIIQKSEIKYKNFIFIICHCHLCLALEIETISAVDSIDIVGLSRLRPFFLLLFSFNFSLFGLEMFYLLSDFNTLLTVLLLNVTVLLLPKLLFSFCFFQ